VSDLQTLPLQAPKGDDMTCLEADANIAQRLKRHDDDSINNRYLGRAEGP
jgi:hypothetical protein